MNRFVAFIAVLGLVCGCQKPPAPAPEAQPPEVAPAVQLAPEPPVQPTPAAPAPLAGRPNYDHLKPIFFIGSIKPADDADPAPKGSVVTYGLTTADLDRIRALPGVADLYPVRFIPAEAKYRDRTATVRIAATVAGYAEVHLFKLSAGRFLTATDNTDLNNVCVLKPRVAKELFAAEDPLGQSVAMRGHVFRVVGVLSEDRGEDDPSVYVPYQTARAFGQIIASKGKRAEKVDMHEIIVRAADPDKRGEVVSAVRDVLEKAHPNKDWEFTYPP